MIDVQHIYKTFQNGALETEVLKDISFTIPSGSFVSIIGPSGSGKSTLLYQLSLLDRPTSGEIFIDGTCVTSLKDSLQTTFRLDNFGYVFQDYALLPELTVLENIILPSLMAGVPKKTAIADAVEMATLLDLQDELKKLPSFLSGGQQQRASIARAAVRKPSILFADEPTANLDSERSREVIQVFKKLNSLGQTILMVTHEMEFAKETHRIIELRDGGVKEDRVLL